MRVRAKVVLLTVTLALIGVGACNESSPPVNKPGDDTINGTHEPEAGLPAPNPTEDSSTPMDPPMYDVGTGYAPALDTCGSCSCDMTKSFCFAGGTHGITPTDAPPPACTLVDASTVQIGCNPLPASCTANPTCDCIEDAIQTQFGCYLVCTPDPGYFLVYCPSPP